MAARLGIRTPISTNYAMTLGGLEQGVTVLDMAHAYETFATGGELVYGTLSPGAGDYDPDDPDTTPGPVGIQSITEDDGDAVKLEDGRKATNKTERERILDDGVAANVNSLLGGVVSYGTGKRAAVSGVTVAGKTGTTENYGDAWFVGYTEDYTVAVWVGYPDSVKSMSAPNFTYGGEPVAGGTFPAAIFSSFINSRTDHRRGPRRRRGEDTDTETPAPVTTDPVAPVDDGHDRRGACRAQSRRRPSIRSRRSRRARRGGAGALRRPSPRPPHPRPPPSPAPDGSGGGARSPLPGLAPRAAAATRADCRRRRSATAGPRPS